MTDARPAVLAANEAFYTAFRERDVTAMDELWARYVPVACTHPGWETLVGRAEVMKSWRSIMKDPRSPWIFCREPRVLLPAEDLALVLCSEEVGESVLAGTNVFVREDGQWRLCHHHAGPGRGPSGEADEEPPGLLH